MRATDFSEIVFVCTGNTCRSPMAEALFRDLMRRRGITAPAVGSAGLAAFAGDSASDEAVRALAELNLSLDGHRARRVTEEMLRANVLFVPVTAAHAKALASAGVPAERMILLGEIGDPYGGGLDDYRRTRDALRQELERLADRLFGRPAGDAP